MSRRQQRCPLEYKQKYDRVDILSNPHQVDCACDEIRITTNPRFKDSQASGSEWRLGSRTKYFLRGTLVDGDDDNGSVESKVSGLLYECYAVKKLTFPTGVPARINFYYKGTQSRSVIAKDLMDALIILPAMYEEWVAFTSGSEILNPAEELCDQEGCSSPWTNVYKMKKTYCARCGQEDQHLKEFEAQMPINVRKFCAAHSHRGSQGCDDGNSNYELIGGSGEAAVDPAVRAVPAQIFMGVFDPITHRTDLSPTTSGSNDITVPGGPLEQRAPQ